MKLRFASLAILCLALAAVPAFADYDNGPINGTTDAWTINFGYIVSDTFTNSGSTVAGFRFGVWEFPGDSMFSVLWTITSAPDVPNARGIVAFGTATQNGGRGGTLSDQFISTNQYGYNIDLITVSGLSVNLQTSTYWLNLQNAVMPSGDPVYWDENSGKGCGGSGCPSQAFQNGVGTIPSEAFTVNTWYCCSSEPTGTPEPGSILLFGSGILGLVGVLRCKWHL